MEVTGGITDRWGEHARKILNAVARIFVNLCFQNVFLHS
jgi:hypothetical protein